MKKLNNKGFGAVEILLILLLVGLVGGVGYYVWHQRNSKSNTTDTSTASTNANKTTATYKVPDGYMVYTNVNGFKFVYPKVYDPLKLVGNSQDYESQPEIDGIVQSSEPKTAYVTGTSGFFTLTTYKTSDAAFLTVKYGPTIKISGNKLIVTEDNPGEPTPYKAGDEYKPYKTSTVNGITVYTFQSVDEGGLAYLMVFVVNDNLVSIALPRFNTTGDGLGTDNYKPSDQKPYDALYNNVLNSISSL